MISLHFFGALELIRVKKEKCTYIIYIHTHKNKIINKRFSSQLYSYSMSAEDNQEIYKYFSRVEYQNKEMLLFCNIDYMHMP